MEYDVKETGFDVIDRNETTEMTYVWNLLQNLYDTTHLTLGMLLLYLGKLKT